MPVLLGRAPLLVPSIYLCLVLSCRYITRIWSERLSTPTPMRHGAVARCRSRNSACVLCTEALRTELKFWSATSIQPYACTSRAGNGRERSEKEVSMLAYVYVKTSDVCWRMLYADVCWRMLTYADVCWRMLTYADVCWRMLTYADVCWRMLMRSTSRRTRPSPRRKLLAGAQFTCFTGTKLQVLTQLLKLACWGRWNVRADDGRADVCWRMLTNALCGSAKRGCCCSQVPPKLLLLQGYFTGTLTLLVLIPLPQALKSSRRLQHKELASFFCQVQDAREIWSLCWGKRAQLVYWLWSKRTEYILSLYTLQRKPS